MAFYLSIKEVWRNRGRFLLFSLVIALITLLVLFVAVTFSTGWISAPGDAFRRASSSGDSAETGASVAPDLARA